ncbi:multisubunit potassium/proton antiporter, PhaE subunit [Pseudorhodobacter antarcticus]|jgi:multicomponent K+:H+ antiporter subunit E|uniref:Multisubunit potassium/proton antiporter, PhaE subunit n=1 Tax=Pseudorhodobacter antarcticus TaxID=1077947 RepID=A0A1H8E4C5_9RHOB|nr:Na+/H+ antiporter subunit E [Pseudorhodobacter antarcticus]SEN13964.1 multisubunit potassium/proton antiporter, PhaE subunit [Pseudorhodobacter antarcticus]
MLRKLFPHPYLTLLLIITWMLLVNQIKLGSLVLAIILGTIIPIITGPYWPDRPVLRNPMAMIGYILVVLYDIVKSNFIVAGIVLFRRNSTLQSKWITVPLDLRSPEAITVLAGTITMTPGTVTADMSGDGRALLIHCLHAPDPDAVRDEIKSRYEARLKRIFE